MLLRNQKKLQEKEKIKKINNKLNLNKEGKLGSKMDQSQELEF